MRYVRHSARLARETLAYAHRSGRWWMVAVIAVLATAGGVAAAGSAVVPASVYVLF